MFVIYDVMYVATVLQITRLKMFYVVQTITWSFKLYVCYVGFSVCTVLQITRLMMFYVVQTITWSFKLYVYYLGFSVSTVLQITTDPRTPPYPAAIWIRFRCDVLTPFSISYNWIGYCNSQGSKRVIFRSTNYNITGIVTLRVRSTPTSCIDAVVCSAVDSMGNSGEATRQIDNVTGKR